MRCRERGGGGGERPAVRIRPRHNLWLFPVIAAVKLSVNVSQRLSLRVKNMEAEDYISTSLSKITKPCLHHNVDDEADNIFSVHM